ncbi:MAG: carboxypeptidase-like regulatory domain-containing protein [Myxococcota bacterium]
MRHINRVIWSVTLVVPGFFMLGCEEDVCSDPEVTCADGAPVVDETPPPAQTGTLTGNTCSMGNAQPAAGVSVVLMAAGSGERVAAGSSDANGTVTITDIPAGTYEVSISERQGMQDVAHGAVPMLTIEPGVVTQLSDPACQAAPAPTGTVRGQICDQSQGVWVTNAAITLMLSDGAMMNGATDNSGRFALSAVPAGSHQLHIQSASYQRIYPVTVVGNQETVVDSPATCERPTGSVEGLVCATTGGVASGATAYIDLPGVRVSDETGADGRFLLSGVPAGVHQVHILVGAEEQVQTVDVLPGQTAQVGPGSCEPPAPGSVEGHFCNPQGGALVGATVRVDVSSGTLTETTDADGRFSLTGVEPGARVVRVEHVDFTADYPVTVTSGGTVTVDPTTQCAPVEEPKGDITGRICAPNGTTWLANARVWVDLTAGGTSETQTDPEGRFTLTAIPVGLYTVHVAAGSFTTEIPDVRVREDLVTEVGDAPETCVPVVDPKVAVVSGRYDDIGSVLVRLGLDEIDTYNGENGNFASTLLGDYSLMQQYDVIFFNCGIDESFLMNPGMRATAVANLQQYVQSGKSVYASDWAYDLVEAAWPTYVDFLDYDGEMNSAELGDADVVTADVVDAALGTALGHTQVEIKFNLAEWAVISQVSGDTTVYIRGSAWVCTAPDPYYGCVEFAQVDNVPFTVGFHPGAGAGKVIYTSFHQEQQTTQDMDDILDMLVFEL